MPLRWRPLHDVLAGEILLPGSSAYELSYPAFNARFHDLRPRAIVRCASPEDVSEAIAFVARHGLPLTTRSGGHCFAGRSSTRGVLVDVGPLQSVSVSAGIASVGAGARLGDVYDTLEAGGRTIAGGTCPAVGIAGLTLGGGLGILGRSYGVTSDRLIGAQIVLADGRIIDCDERRDPELFWALRGAGAGTVGIVTSLAFATVPARASTNVHLSWPWEAAEAVIAAWQAWAPHGPDELAASLKITDGGPLDRPPSVDLYAAMAASATTTDELIEPLVVQAGFEPATSSSRYLSHTEARAFWAAIGDGHAAPTASMVTRVHRSHLFARSEFFRHPLPREVITALLEHVTTARAVGEARELDFMPWGGAYNRMRPDATAFVHRREQFLLKHSVTTDHQPSPAQEQNAWRWVDGSWATVHPWGSGRVFQNFADTQLGPFNRAYHGANLERLRRVRARYDPHNAFSVRQSRPA